MPRSRARHNRVMTHVALVFPGRKYGPEMPVLHYPAEVVRQQGAVVHVVRYPPSLIAADDPNDRQWEEVIRVIAAEAAEHIAGATHITLIAKSLGTRVIARLPLELMPKSVDAVWLTPIFVDAATADAAAAKVWRSLYVYGTADPACNEAALLDIAAATAGRVLAVPGGDHGLEVEGDAVASVAALLRLTRETLAWATA